MDSERGLSSLSEEEGGRVVPGEGVFRILSRSSENGEDMASFFLLPRTVAFSK